MSFIIYTNLEFIIEKTDGCKNNLENSSTTKVSKHIRSGFSMSTISSFRSIGNKHDLYRSKDCMKKFGKFLRQHAMRIINLKKKNEIINKGEEGSNENAKICYTCKENFESKYLKDI